MSPDATPAPESQSPARRTATPKTPLLPDVAAELGTLWLDILRQIHESSNILFKHDDAMLTWAIGLMGAGMFYANTLLAAVPDGLRFFALAPWIVGILAALAARVMGSRTLQQGDVWYMKEVLAFKGAVVVSKDILDTLTALYSSIARLIAGAFAQQSGLYWWRFGLSLATHILAGTGVLAVVTVSFLDTIAATVVIMVLVIAAVIIFVRAFGAVRKEFKRNLQETMTAVRKSLKPTEKESPA